MNCDSALLNFADELLVKIVEFLPMKDRVSVRAACSRLEKIVAITDLSMARYIMQFYQFDGTPWSTPFGMQEQGIDSKKMEEFVLARSRMVKRINVSEVVLDKIDFEKVDFELVRILLTDVSFDKLFIVQNNVEYNERVESLITEYRGKKIVLSALYFPYFKCIGNLSADIELRFNYLHREKVPGPGGKNEDLLLKLVQKGHNICAANWSTPYIVKQIFDVVAKSDHEQVVTLKTFDLASFFNTIGLEKSEHGLKIRDGQGAHSLVQQREGNNTSVWSFSHVKRLYAMTNNDNLIWLSNRSFRISMHTCPMHCELCESMKKSQGSDNVNQLCGNCSVCRCASFYRF